MKVVLELNPEVEQALLERARSTGFDLNDYVEELIRKDVDGVLLDEQLAPVRKQFEESRMTEDELDEFMNGVREKAFRERRSQNE